MKKITLSLFGFLLISYSFAHTNADDAIEFYSSTAVKYSDSCDTSLHIVSFYQDNSAFNDFKMTPNPAHSKFQLIVPKGLKNVKLEIFDVLGKKILTRALSKLSSTVEVSKWNDGVYLVKITSDTGTHIKRFIKQ